MTAYDSMISGDNTYTPINAFKCNVAVVGGAAASVITTVALSIEAAVSAVENINGTATKAARPSNLVAAINSPGSVDGTT